MKGGEKMNGSQARKIVSGILSCAASIGVIVTTVTAIKATPKALELIHNNSKKNHDGDPYAFTKKEAVTSAWKCYIPSAAIGVSTIACIIGANILTGKQQIALSSAYALIQNSYKEYKDKLKELYGEEAHNAIVDAIVKENCNDTHITTVGGWLNTTLDFGEGDEPEVTRLFYDSYSKRYFESTIEKVIQAEYHLNRNFVFRGITALNELYDFLGLPNTSYGDNVGWSSYDEIYWLDFNHRRAKLKDGTEIYIIEMVYEPATDFDKKDI